MSTSLEAIARHVNWHTDPQRVLADVDLFLSQVMARGSLEDIVAVQQRYSQEDFRKAYLAAPPGLFTKRAWAYWGLCCWGIRAGLCRSGFWGRTNLIGERGRSGRLVRRQAIEGL